MPQATDSRTQCIEIDLDLALRTIHALGQQDGDLGQEYWYKISELLKSASNLKTRVWALEHEVGVLKAASLRPGRVPVQWPHDAVRTLKLPRSRPNRGRGERRPLQRPGGFR